MAFSSCRSSSNGREHSAVGTSHHESATNPEAMVEWGSGILWEMVEMELEYNQYHLVMTNIAMERSTIL